jgi:hypothetical protein
VLHVPPISQLYVYWGYFCEGEVVGSWIRSLTSIYYQSLEWMKLYAYCCRSSSGANRLCYLTPYFWVISLIFLFSDHGEPRITETAYTESVDKGAHLYINYKIYILTRYIIYFVIYISLLRGATGWTVWGSSPGGDEIFFTRPDQHWSPPSLL